MVSKTVLPTSFICGGVTYWNAIALVSKMTTMPAFLYHTALRPSAAGTHDAVLGAAGADSFGPVSFFFFSVLPFCQLILHQLYSLSCIL